MQILSCIFQSVSQSVLRSVPPFSHVRAAPKKAIYCEKDVKSKVAAKKWLDGWLMEKILITTILVNFVPNPSETWRRQHKFT